jgi:hypothetical protein
MKGRLVESNLAEVAFDTPKPLEPCRICQRVVDFLQVYCGPEIPNKYILAQWTEIMNNHQCPTCQKVARMLYSRHQEVGTWPTMDKTFDMAHRVRPFPPGPMSQCCYGTRNQASRHAVLG